MDLRFTAEEQAFRQELRIFIDANLSPDTRDRLRRGEMPTKQDIVTWQRTLNARGWATPSWPREFGGPGWSPVQRLIFLEETGSAPAPELLSFNVNMIGPVLIQFGTPEQQQRFLRRAANVDDWWCQGFSEPGAGSDLASLRTAARRDGEHYVVTGQKTWTTLAQHADWMFCLVRTDPQAKKQEGISFLLLDMNSPGVTVRPIRLIDGSRHVNEVFLDEVRVPADQLVGRENRGWDVAKFLLSNERIGITRLGRTKERLARALEIATEIGAIDDPTLRRRFAALEVEMKALEMTQLRVVSAPRPAADKPDPFSSILKIKGTELQQAVAALLLDVAGPMALAAGPGDRVNEPDEMPDWAAPAAAQYLFARAFSIYGGSNEIQKSILAKSVLGL